MKKVVTGLLVLSLAGIALAQERQFLSKPEVETLAQGKKWNLVRTADGNKVEWDLRSGGSLYGNNFSSNRRDSGTWLVNDEAQLCVKWRGSSPDKCVGVTKEKDTLKLIDSKDLSGVLAVLSVE